MIDLADNRIEEINQGVFAGLNVMVFLNLSNNFNAKINGRAFNDLGNVLLLDIWNIDLRNIERGAFLRLNRLFYLYHEASLRKDLRENVNFLSSARLNLWEYTFLMNVQKADLEGEKAVLWLLGHLLIGNDETQSLLTWVGLSLLDSSYGKNQTTDERVLKFSRMLRSYIISRNVTVIETWHLAFISSYLLQSTETVPIIPFINLSNTRIRRIGRGVLEIVPDILWLDLAVNSMRRVENHIFYGQESLLRLNLSNNEIVEIEEFAFNGLTRLVDLDLSKNNIRAIYGNSFAGLFALLQVFLSDNPLLVIDGNAFAHTPRLTGLHLSRSNTTEVAQDLLAGVPKLCLLYLRDNHLQRLAPGTFIDNDYLLRLYVENNDITVLENGTFLGLEQLWSLYLSNNNITFIEAGAFDGLKNLWWLILVNAGIHRIERNTFHGLETLFYMDLSKNNLRMIESNSFENLETLTELDLSRNGIIEIKGDAFVGLENLVTLDLSHNNISAIDSRTFKDLDSLYALNLSTNFIQRLLPNSFSNQAQLTYLDLSYNPITVVEPNAFANLSRLEYLLLAGAELRIVDGNTVSPLKSLKALSTSDTRLCCLLQDRMNTTCTSTVPSNPLDTCGSLFPSGVLRVFGWLMGLSALIGNCGVLYYRLYHEQDSRAQNQLIANLAVADCVMAVYMIVVTSADLHFGSNYFLAAPLWRDSVMCKFAGSLAFLSSEASVISLSLITLDRFTCIVFPFGSWRMTHRMCRIILSITWIIVLVISIPSMIDSSKIPDFYGQSDVCIGLPLHLTSGETGVLVTTKESEWSRDYTVTFLPLDNAKRPPWLYSIVVFIGINLFSFIFIAICYIIMFIKVRRSSKATKNTASRSREIKVARRMAILIGTDFACWMPIILMGILSQTNTVDIPTTLYAWSVIFILPINSSLNPMLYTFMYYLDKGKKPPKNRRA
ncbi:uncharacterized protein [Diadema antillarum]|uniref:uncharacterized protein isoform X1 n=3 Tax=Diadema antillarum TaxID=105358 RepID=UPI003A86FB59